MCNEYVSSEDKDTRKLDTGLERFCALARWEFEEAGI